MLTDRLRQRLEQIHQRSQPLLSRDVASNKEHTRHRQVSDERTELGGREVTTAWGPHLLIRQSIDAVWPASRHYLTDRMRSSLDDVAASCPSTRTVSSPPEFTDDLAALAQCFPRRAIYLDLETCGFAGSMVFLVGLLHWHEGELVLSQLWARNYAEEKAILQSLWTILADNELLITFNGKSFDWPQVHDRSTLHHLGFRPLSVEDPQPPKLPLTYDGPGLAPTDARPEPWHVDLLHHARRRWRHELPNCRLQTLERYLCGRHRVGDLAGSKIPVAYHDYVRSGQTNDARAILHHNALDLVTLLQLALLFLE